jgi:hypothetical protein
LAGLNLLISQLIAINDLPIFWDTFKAIANNDAVTVLSAQDANAAFSRNAIILATRLPEVPLGGNDLALMREVVTDPRSGLSFELAVYPGYRMVHYEIGVLWGAKVLKPEHICLLAD